MATFRLCDIQVMNFKKQLSLEVFISNSDLKTYLNQHRPAERFL